MGCEVRPKVCFADRVSFRCACANVSFWTPPKNYTHYPHRGIRLKKLGLEGSSTTPICNRVGFQYISIHRSSGNYAHCDEFWLFDICLLLHKWNDGRRIVIAKRQQKIIQVVAAKQIFWDWIRLYAHLNALAVRRVVQDSSINQLPLNILC